MKLDQGNLDAAKINVDYTQITAPIDGRVGCARVDPGNIVQANGTTGIVTITQLQPITVIFTMAEDYIDEVVQADASTATSSAWMRAAATMRPNLPKARADHRQPDRHHDRHR